MISLIVPVYNVRSYIEEFLQSVVGQTYEDYEALLIDDGSNDGTETILDEYAKKYDKLKVSHKENGGVISAWKMGIEIARGEYIAFADPDDILLPNMLATLNQFMTTQNVDIVICGIKRLINGSLIETVADQRGLPEGVYTLDDLELLKKSLFGDMRHQQTTFHFWKVNKLFKKSILLSNLRYSPNGLSFGEDVCISASAIYDSVGLYYTHTPLYVYRIRDNSLTTVKFNSNQIDDAHLLITSVRRMLTDKGYMNDFIYYNDPSYHILRLMEKINSISGSKRQKKKLLKTLKNHPFVAEYDLHKAKRYISKRRYFAIWLLKHSLFGLLTLLLPQKNL